MSGGESLRDRAAEDPDGFALAHPVLMAVVGVVAVCVLLACCLALGRCGA